MPTAHKEIKYSRLDRDYDAYLNGEYVGSFGSYHAAEVALDHIYSDMLADAAATTCQADEGCAEQANHDGLCCYHYDQEGHYCPCYVSDTASDPAPDDADGDDCPSHGPYADDDCPKCESCRADATLTALDGRREYDLCTDCACIELNKLHNREWRIGALRPHTVALPRCVSCGDVLAVGVRGWCAACVETGEKVSMQASNALYCLQVGIVSANELNAAIGGA